MQKVRSGWRWTQVERKVLMLAPKCLGPSFVVSGDGVGGWRLRGCGDESVFDGDGGSIMMVGMLT